MNSLFKKVICLILVLLLTVTVFSGCSAGNAKFDVNDIYAQGDQIVKNPDFLAKLRAFWHRFVEFFGWWTNSVNKFFYLIEIA